MLYQLPIPKYPEVFENLVCDLLNEVYKTTSFSLYGRKGQKQHGIDILSAELSIVAQCKLRTLNLQDRKTKISFIQEVRQDMKAIFAGGHTPQRIIIATTIENDTLIQDELQSILFLREIPVRIEFWSWSKISNALFLYPPVVQKYFPFRQQQVELARIAVLNKSVYRKSSENDWLFNYQNSKGRSHLPVFDFTFINNTDNTVTLNAVEGFMVPQAVVRGGFPPTPSGIVKPTGKYVIDLKSGLAFGEYGRAVLDFEDPVYAHPKAAFRIQIQNRKPILNFYKIYFVFNFNNATIKTPELYFNAYNTFSGVLHREI